MLDVIRYTDSNDSLNFSINCDAECEHGLAESTEHPKPPVESNMKFNQGNYSPNEYKQQ